MNSLIKSISSYPSFSVNLSLVWKRNIYLFKNNLFTSIFWMSFEPILIFLVIGFGLNNFVGKIDGVPYVVYFFPAVLAINSMLLPFYETAYSVFNRSKKSGVYNSILYTPVETFDIIWGEIIWMITKTFFSSILLFGIAFIFGVIDSFQSLAAIPVLLLSAWLFSAMGMFVGFMAKTKDLIVMLQVLIALPMVLLSNTFFPLEKVGKQLYSAALVSPLIHISDSIRAIILNDLHSHNFIQISIVLILAYIFTSAANYALLKKLNLFQD